jgi:hypothetical protein
LLALVQPERSGKAQSNSLFGNLPRQDYMQAFTTDATSLFCSKPSKLFSGVMLLLREDLQRNTGNIINTDNQL